MNDFSQKLDLRQGQNLVMTPQLQQAIKLLQLNNAELLEFVEEEISQNPLLEKKENDPETDLERSQENAPEENVQTDDVQAGFDQAWDSPNADSQEAMQDFDPGSGSLNTGTAGSSGFEGLDKARMKAHQYKFFSMVFSGIPEDVDIVDVVLSKHERLFREKGLNASHFDLVAGHFVGALESLQVPPELIKEATEVLVPLRPVFDQGAAKFGAK